MGVNCFCPKNRRIRIILVYVLSESADKIMLIRFGPSGAEIERDITTGLTEPDINRPRVIAVSPDNRYAFISVAGIGSEPGTVKVIDLEVLKRVTTVDVAAQAAGIDFLKTEAVKRND